MGIPKAIITFLQDVNRSLPELPADKKLDEAATLEKQGLNEALD